MKLSALTGENVIVVLLLVAAGLIIFYSYIYYKESRQAHRLTGGQLWMLRLLRIGVALVAVVALTKPALTLIQTETRLPVVGMLVDESSSMAFPDSRDNPLVQDSPADQRTRYDTAKKVLQRVQEPLSLTHRVRVYTFSDSLHLLKEVPYRPEKDLATMGRDEIFEEAKRPTGDYTNLGEGGLELLRRLADDQISAVVLLSDGRQTGGVEIEALAEQAKAAKVRVHTVVLGTEFPLRDLRIDEVHVGAEASLGDVLIFHVKVTNQIEESLKVPLTLLEEGKKVAARTLLLHRGTQVVTIASIPDVEGVREFRLELPVQQDEIDTENNVAVVNVKVVKRTLRVLLIAGEPSREYVYMVPALLRDPIIDLSCYLQSADVDYVQQGNSNVEELPKTLEAWTRFDVAILHDVDPNDITVQQVSGLEHMVNKGGGLMLIAGRTQGLAKLVQVHAAKIRGLLPVEVDKNLHPDYDQYFDTAFEVRRTSEGKNHPIMMVSSDENTNERVWKTFPALYWYHPVIRPKSKAIVLLEKSSGSGGGGGSEDCLMAIQRYGEGAILYCGIDSLWLWRYPFESYDYDRCWTRAIRYLGEARLMGTQQQVSLTTDRRTYAPGEDVLINLRILDPALLRQLAGLQLYASVTSPQKDEHMVPLQLALGQPVYVGTYRARRTGTMAVRARQAAPGADTEAKPLFDVPHEFQVKMQSLEKVDTSADLEAMEDLARATGGQYFYYGNMSKIDSLPEQISTDPQVLKRELVVEIWDGVTFLLLFLVLVATEWSLRKWWGLL